MKVIRLPRKKVGNVAGTFQLEDDDLEVVTSAYVPRPYLKDQGYSKGEGPEFIELHIPSPKENKKRLD